MQLSSTARRAMAAGLAVSTIVWSMAMFVMPVAFAAPHGNGCLINQSGTIYLVENGVKRGFPSADVYASHGQNFGQVVTANSEDSSLPTGPVMVYRDGTLVKGPSDPLVYLVANGQKRGFISGSVYTGLGYSWANVRTAAVNTFADLPTGANLESATERHTNGIMVKDSTGTIWIMTATGKKGMPSMEVFNSYGYRMSEVVPANAADVAATNEGVLTARVVCSDSAVVTGSVNAALASDTPASTTVISRVGAGTFGQIAADIAHFTFTGNGTVNGLTFKRIGVSDTGTMTNVYLYDGANRLTDSSTVSSDSTISFANGNGLFTVNGSKTISVKADIDHDVSGQTVGIQLVSGTLSNGSLGGSLPASGNLMSVSSSSNLATARFGTVTPSGTPTTDPTTGLTVWQSQLTVNTHDLNLTRMTLREVGSINSTNIGNFKLVVDSNQVASVSNLDANGLVNFNVSPAKTLAQGVHTVKVLADVTGGSSRTFSFSLRNRADIGLVDTTFGVEVGLDNTGVNTPNLPITAGVFTVSGSSTTNNNLVFTKATDSPSGDVMTNGRDVVLGKWTVNAYGEAVKVETLNATATLAGTQGTVGGVANQAVTIANLRNGRLMINGSQYGATQNFVVAGTTYTVNYTFPVGTPTTVELRADIYGTDTAANPDWTGALTAGTIRPTIVQPDAGNGFSTGNGQGVTSSNTIDVPGSDVDAGTVNIVTGAISMAANSNYGAQTTTVPQTNYKVASFNLTGSSTEDVNIDTISVDFTRSAVTFPLNSLTNITLKYAGTAESQVKTTLSDAAATANASWSVSHVLAKNAIVPIEIYANINSTPTVGNIHTDATVSGTTAASGVAANTGAIAGQTITVGSGAITTTADGSTPAAKLVDDNSSVTTAAFKFAPQYDSYTITELTVGVTNASSVQNVILKDGTTVLGTKPGATSVTFYGLNVPVNANSSKVLTVDLQLGTVGAGTGASGSAITTSLTGYKANTAAGQKTHADDANTANFPLSGSAMYVFASVPTVTPVTLPSSVLTVGTSQTIAKFTVSSNGTGTVSWKKIILNTSISSAHVEVANPTLWDADSGLQVPTTTDTVAAATGGAITFVTTNEQEISGAKTYLVKMDISAVAGQTIVAGDYVSTNITGGTGHVVPDDYTAVAGTGATFVWSDESGIGHSAASVTVLDWNNDYLVKNLPTDSQTLTK